MPLISVIMPAYNAGNFIEESINCVIKQTFQDWELIIVDDGSVDNTREIVQPYIEGDKRINYLYQTNGRQGKARNNGIKHSSGKYVAFLDADDLWHHEKLEKQNRCIQETKSDIVFAGCSIFEDSIESNLQNYVTPAGFISKEQNPEIFFSMNPVPILTVLAKKECLSAVGCFSESEEIQNAEDYHLWLKLLLSDYIFYGMEEKLSFYRKHHNQTTSKDNYATVPVINVLQSLGKLPAKFNSPKKKRLKELYIRLLNYSTLYNKQDIVQTFKRYYKKPFQPFLYPLIQFIVGIFGVRFAVKCFLKVL